MSAVVIVIFLFVAWGSADEETEEVKEVKTAANISLLSSAPQQQKDFTKALLDIKNEYEAGLNHSVNDIQKKELQSELVKKRKQLLKDALGGKLGITNWVGRVKTIYSDDLLNNGNVQVSIILPDYDGTPLNLDLTNSDIYGTFLVKKNSELYTKLRNIAEDSNVVFSGSFVPNRVGFIDSNCCNNEVWIDTHLKRGLLDLIQFKFTDVKPL